VSAALVFDIDHTLTIPDKPPTAAIAAALARVRVPFALAAGSDLEMLEHRFIRRLHGLGLRADFEAFLCNGTIRYHCHLGDACTIELVRDFSLEVILGAAGHARLLATIDEALRTFPLPAEIEVLPPDVAPRVRDRRAMLNVAPIGRLVAKGDPERDAAYDRSRRAFEAFDAASGYRDTVRAWLGPRLTAIHPGLVAKLGGRTSFDLNLRGEDKRYAVRTMLEEGADEVVYFGDALFPGGNDEAVLELRDELPPAERGRITAVRVDGPEDTAAKLAALGWLG
jgi:hydroxymethylpyrimidine pyrophosphatase-like HAD family hydrolase